VKDPHLDVTVVAEGTPPGQVPAGVTGYCATGTIDKEQATHDISDKIHDGDLCGKKPVLDVASHFNDNHKVSAKKLTRVVRRFCQKYMLGFEQINKGKGLVKKCYKDIVSKSGPGWAKVFCAANTLVSKDPLECVSGLKQSVDCVTCTSDILDFGWDYAINKWDSTKPKGEKPGPTCLTVAQLPPDLFECQRGIRIQYFLDGEWITYKAIPQGYTLCRSSGGFNSVTDAVLFQNKIRFTECGTPLVPPGTCPDADANACNAEDGFTVSLTTVTSTKVPELGIVELVDNHKLICNPVLYPGSASEDCFKEAVNPCPSCTGACKSKGYVSPCGDASSDTCHMCVDPLSLLDN